MIQTYQSNNRTEKPSPRAEIELVHDEKSKETLITAQDKVWSLPEMIQSAHIHFYTPENQRTGAKCTDTRFYTQCGTKQENQRHYQMHTHPLLHTMQHRVGEWKKIVNCTHTRFHTQCGTGLMNQMKGFIVSTSTQLRRTCVHVFPCIPDEG
jgi:hypothetical protein